MTDHQQAAIDAGMPIMRCRTHCPNDTDCKTCESEVQKIIAAAEPHLRKKWAEEAEKLMPEMGSHINVTPYREGVADGINRVLRLLEGDGE